MSQIVSSLPNKFEQGIFAALCFDFSLSKNLAIYVWPIKADYLCFMPQIPTTFVSQFLVVIGSAKVKPFFIPATILVKKTVYFYLNFLKLSLSVK